MEELENALRNATIAGVLDELACYIHPDIINQFCDAVTESLKLVQKEVEA